jgi:putative transposase
MSTYTQIYYHIVFATKNRVPALQADRRDELYKYFWGILQNKQCRLYRIGGVEDHVHFLIALHPAVCLAGLVKDLKVASSVWIKENALFPLFDGWQNGYGAFTHSSRDKDRLVEYIRHQEEHHRAHSFRDELASLLREAGIEYDEKYLT